MMMMTMMMKMIDDIDNDARIILNEEFQISLSTKPKKAVIGNRSEKNRRNE